jgi:hypothetical protein
MSFGVEADEGRVLLDFPLMTLNGQNPWRIEPPNPSAGLAIMGAR